MADPTPATPARGKLNTTTTSPASAGSAKRRDITAPAKGTPLRPVESGDTTTNNGGESDDEDEEGPSLETMRAFGRQIQRAPQTSGVSTTGAGPAAKVVIPKRGEKDFEPLNETVTIQEKMLRESRQALFDGLGGVRGTSSKNISHATLSPAASPFPQVQVVRGNLFLTIGHTIRPAYNPAEKGKPCSETTDPGTTNLGSTTTTPAGGNPGSTMELLPEEALYLLERGSLQIWCAPSVYNPSSPSSENGNEPPRTWDEQVQGFNGMVEMTAMEGFSRFIGQDGLSLERYQVYAGLKRLGYTVQRTDQFLPPRFRKQGAQLSSSPLTKAQAVGKPSFSQLRQALAARRMALVRMLECVWGRLRSLFCGLVNMVRRLTGVEEGQTLLGRVHATGYGALYQKLRIIPSGHSHPVTVPHASAAATRKPSTTPSSNMDSNGENNAQEEEDPFARLVGNPYLPFFHVWKPNTHWTRGKWDRGSAEGLRCLPPDFWIAVVDARSVPFPTLPQLEQIFPTLPALPKPLIRSRTPATTAANTTKPKPTEAATTTGRAPIRFLHRLLTALRLIRPGGQKTTTAPLPQQPVNTFLALKQGDRSLIIAVVDGGNVGWTRLGRGGFEDHVMVPNEML